MSLHKVLALVVTILLSYCAVTASPSGRIVGGDNAVSKQFPYQISLRMNHFHICGGSIIDAKHILTAAHCVVETDTTAYDAENFTIRAGTHNRIAGGVVVAVKKITVHQGYSLFLNDLAVLELEEELEFSDTIRAIELATEEVPPGSEVIISGWGYIEDGGVNTPITLQWNTVEALSKTKCATKIVFYADSLICLDHPKGKGACNGDSGGPAVYDNKLVGVAGFVVTGCASSRPDGYAKVAYNIDWIHEQMA